MCNTKLGQEGQRQNFRAVRDARQEGPAVAKRRAGNWSIGHEAAEEKAAGNGAADEGLNMTTKTLINASCGGSYKDKNAQEACLLFEKMAADTQQWAVEQPQSRSVFEMSNSSPYVTTQIEKMEKILDAKFDMLLQRIPCLQVAVQQPLQAACSICSLTNHDFLSCPHKDAYPEFMAEQVNSFNNFQRPRYDPYSNFYNPGWRDHPNLKWDKDQHFRPQFQQQVQQHSAPKAAWEVAIEKLANTTSQEIQNLHASMKNMEKQIGQIALQVSERAPGAFPNQTVPNPRGREECNAVHTLRSGKSYISKHENSVENSQAAELPQPKSANFADSEISVDSGASVNLMPYSVFKRLGEGELKPTSTDFMVLDMDEDLTTPIILGRPFLVAARTLIDVEARTLKIQVEDHIVVFKLFEASIHSGSISLNTQHYENHSRSAEKSVVAWLRLRVCVDVHGKSSERNAKKIGRKTDLAFSEQ
ncbi:unnamed protein product [Malus baccata var. baccata]